MGGSRIVSAQVILRPASGRSAREGTITAATIGEYLPDPEKGRQIRDFFRELGFDTGEIVGTSFAITATMGIFEKVFDTKLGSRNTGAAGGYEPPLDALENTIAESVEAVTFTPPPDFGPTDY